MGIFGTGPGIFRARETCFLRAIAPRTKNVILKIRGFLCADGILGPTALFGLSAQLFWDRVNSGPQQKSVRRVTTANGCGYLLSYVNAKSNSGSIKEYYINTSIVGVSDHI